MGNRKSSKNKENIIYKEKNKRFWVFQLITEVRNDGVYIKFIPFHRSFNFISYEDIRKISVESYSPSKYAGLHWGVHLSQSGNKVYRLDNNTGIELLLDGEKYIFIGSKNPEKIRESIEKRI